MNPKFRHKKEKIFLDSSLCRIFLRREWCRALLQSDGEGMAMGMLKVP
jgi:hypothetical protein